MDGYVKSHLTRWGLEELIPKFADEEVNEPAFKCLTEEIIRELVPKLGKRAIFSNAYNSYREQLAAASASMRLLPVSEPEVPQGETLVVAADLPGILQERETDSTNNQQRGELKDEIIIIREVKIESSLSQTFSFSENTAETPGNSENLNPTRHSELAVEAQEDANLVEHLLEDTPQQSDTQKSTSDPITFSVASPSEVTDRDRETVEALRNLLQQSDTLKVLLGKTFLTRSLRNNLARHIAEYLYDMYENDCSAKAFRRWARAIAIMFPNEIAAFYYRESADKLNRSGRLYKSYRHLCSDIERKL
ncbi:uncharacterized protein LOC129758432 [Uranotaenia lowii]|uniref:uncharacterized protein LOC129758432 n=1 Tax=Uranotaenia lowii TaxID=190385 RepID=UPI002478D2C8|nr:uncharacterized protein LOC129758432 [Uranotaenia lowii]